MSSSLVGMLLDVSGSMEVHALKLDSTNRTEPWANSILRVAEDLIVKTEDCKGFPPNRVFAFGVGAEKKPTNFDMLKTICRITVLKNAEHDNRGKEEIVQEIMDILSREAPSLRSWTTDDMVAENIGRIDAVKFLYALDCDCEPTFLPTVVGFLPSVCLHEYDITSPVSWGHSALNWVTSDSTKEQEVKDVINRIERELSKVLQHIDVSSCTFQARKALKILKQSVDGDEISNERVEEMMAAVAPYIYGGTPLIKALSLARDVFLKTGAQRNMLFILSDGMPSDCTKNDTTQDAIFWRKKLRSAGVDVICCYITQDDIEPRRMYCVEQEDWDRPTKFMYHLSTTISTQNIPRTVFVQKGWRIDFANNETRLFLQVNHPDHIREFAQFARDVVSSQDALADAMNSVSLDLFIDKCNDEYSAPEQKGGTCYANATATVVYLAMKRIYCRNGGYPYYDETEPERQSENFFRLRSEIISQYGTCGANTQAVLDNQCRKHRLRYRKVTIVGAMKAVASKRPVVARFRLSDPQWAAFSAFFKRNNMGILTRGDLGSKRPKAEKTSGHAVVLTSYNSKGLRFMNSWGSSWGDKGFFRIENHNVLDQLEFFDVFWYEKDLLPCERQAYAAHGTQLTIDLAEKLMTLNTMTYPCPECGQNFPMINFGSRALLAVCPGCMCEFRPDPDLALTLYLLSICDTQERPDR